MRKRSTSGPEILPGAGGGSGLGTWSFPGAQQILHVFGDSDNATETGTMRAPFHTVAAAIAAANVLAPAVDNRILILIWPKEGGYVEQVTLADDYVYMAGVSRDGCVLTNPNVGAGATLTVTAEHYGIWNMTIADTGGGRPMVISTAAATAQGHLESCLIQSALLAVRMLGQGAAVFQDCRLVHTVSDWNPILEVLSTGAVTLKSCTSAGQVTKNSAGGDFVVADSRLESSGGEGAVSITTGGVARVHNSVLIGTGTNGMTVKNAVPSELTLLGNRIEVSGAGYAISCQLALTGTTVENNTLIGGGIDPDLSHVNPVKRVGAAAVKDWYGTTQDALTACTFDDCVVELYQDENLSAALGFLQARPVTIDGRGVHTLTTAVGTLLILGGGAYSGRKVTLKRLAMTGWIFVSVSAGTTQEVALVKSTLSGQVAVVAGDVGLTISLTDSRVVGNASLAAALSIGDDDPTFLLDRSFVKGHTGSTAVYWAAGISNPNLKAKHSDIVHGSGGANIPFGSAGGVANVNFRAHHCGFNADPTTFVGPPTFTNPIVAGQQQNTFDANVDWT